MSPSYILSVAESLSVIPVSPYVNIERDFDNIMPYHDVVQFVTVTKSNMIIEMPCCCGTLRSTAVVVVVYSYCVHSYLSMTGPNYSLCLRASRPDGRAPPRLHFIPTDNRMLNHIPNRAEMEEEKNGYGPHHHCCPEPLLWEYGTKSPTELEQKSQLLKKSPADLR